MKKFEFERTFSPGNLILFCDAHTDDELLTADVPCLRDCNRAYGTDTAETFLRTHIFRLCEYLQLPVKPTGTQLTDLAQLIYSDYGDLTPYQFMLFFKRLRTGDYAARDRNCAISVSLNPTAVTMALKLLRKDICEAFDRKARHVEEKEEKVPYNRLALYLYTKWLSASDAEAAAMLLPPEERDARYRDETDIQFYARHVEDYVRFVHSSEYRLSEQNLRLKFRGLIKD